MAATEHRPTAPLFGSLLEDSLFHPFLYGSRRHDLPRAPEAEVVETEHDIRVMLDTPGVAPQDIDLSLENNLLTISGERKPQWDAAEEAHFTWHLSERRYGRFDRSFVLPADVDADRIQAHFENGVLSILVPKSEKARRRRIEIRGDDGAQQVEAGAGS